MTDLEKELVEKLAREWLTTHLDPRYANAEDVWRPNDVISLASVIRSHANALVAAAYAACADRCLEVAKAIFENPSSMQFEAQHGALVCEKAIRSLTPADAAREIERRENALIRETIRACEEVYRAYNIGVALESVTLDAVRERLASLSKPAPVSQTITPGICAKHAIVTPTCRNNRTPLGALAEAVERLQLEYVELLNHEGEDEVTYHFVLTVERNPAPVERSNENG